MKFKIVFFLLSILACSVSSFSQSPESILPTPDSSFFNNPKPLAENIIEKYVKSYFAVTQGTKIIETTSADHPEGIWDCHTRTEYGEISTETYTCDMQFDQTFRIKNYSFNEVNRVLKILFKDDEFEIWNNSNNYGPIEGGAGCYVEIKEEENKKIIVTYGCGC